MLRDLGLGSKEKMERLDCLLHSVVDETLREIFREAGARVIYEFLENHNHLRLEEVAEKTEVFSAGLKKLLGSGAPVIEKLILKNLSSKLELEFEEKEDYEFSDYVKEFAKRRAEKNGR